MHLEGEARKNWGWGIVRSCRMNSLVGGGRKANCKSKEEKL